MPAAEAAEGSTKRSPAKAPADPMAMLRKEVDIMRSLRHPNIVALHEASAIAARHLMQQTRRDASDAGLASAAQQDMIHPRAIALHLMNQLHCVSSRARDTTTL